MALIPILLTGGMLLVFLALSFLFSGYETGLISINQINLENEAKRSKSRAQLLAFVRQPDKFLGTTLIGNNIANVLLASISTYFVHQLNITNLDARYTALFIGVIVLTFGEIMPKAIFRDHAETIVPALFPLIRFFSIVFKPMIMIVTWINNGMQKMLRINGEQHFKYLTKDDLSYLLSQTSSDAISQPHIEMIEDALDFKEQEARNVMVPRTDIVAIPESATITEAIEIARKEGFTRYPVFRQNLDDIVGVLIIYDVLKRDCTENMTAGQIAHEPFFAPENMDLDVLLKEMQQKHRSMSIIVDSYGGTAGIVTMEDILEEIVGDIEDEYDDDEQDKQVEQVSPNTWLAQADVEIDHLADEYGIELPEGSYETIAGLILDKLERIPLQGQFITVDPYRIQVLQATDKKIIKVKIHKIT
ncbi:MAG: hemolysin family protein [Candidatus Cloacimonadaceae bacterium]|nr:hemolysin family protein [Candidatus Cloacimonadaceae bacterium]MDP3115355.1 hemolysin family protein [Candidatus Cloacimonadaceae bacterium]